MLNRNLKILGLGIASLSILAGCGSTNSTSLKGASISEDAKFGSATVNVTIDSFNSLGFKLGDSCDVIFSNGYTLTDIPYFNGYYVKNGEPVIVAYPSSTNILVTLNNTGIWNSAGLSDGDTVDILLNTSGKYLATQEALGQSYSLERSEYSSDEEFSNFRSLKGGNLKEGLIFRGASPLDNSRKRAKITDTLLEKNGIQSIVDLADNADNLTSYFAEADFSSSYAKSLYEDNKIALLSMGSSYGSASYQTSVATGVRHMLNTDGPYYVHCMEGKDRTGFVCFLFEALMGASYSEMKDDYMLTYQNYYKISEDKTPDKYKAVVSLYFDSFVDYLEDLSPSKNDYAAEANQYLLNGGLSQSEIDAFKVKISK